MVSKVSNLETSAWQQRSIRRSDSEIDFKSHWSNAICLVTVECRKSCDTISFVKLYSVWQICALFTYEVKAKIVFMRQGGRTSCVLYKTQLTNFMAECLYSSFSDFLKQQKRRVGGGGYLNKEKIRSRYSNFEKLIKPLKGPYHNWTKRLKVQASSNSRRGVTKSVTGGSYPT